MEDLSEAMAVKKTPKHRWSLLLTGVLVFAALALLLAGYAKYKYLRAHADTLLRDRLVATLSTRFHSPVMLDFLHLDASDGLHGTGKGLKILYLAGPDHPDENTVALPPMVRVDSFEFQTNFKELFQPTTHIVTVFVKGAAVGHTAARYAARKTIT